MSCLSFARAASMDLSGMVETSLEAVVFAEPHGLLRLSRQCPHEPTWLLERVSPSRTRRADFPHRAPQMTFTKCAALHRRMQVSSDGQLEPCLKPRNSKVS